MIWPFRYLSFWSKVFTLAKHMLQSAPKHSSKRCFIFRGKVFIFEETNQTQVEQVVCEQEGVWTECLPSILQWSHVHLDYGHHPTDSQVGSHNIEHRFLESIDAYRKFQHFLSHFGPICTFLPFSATLTISDAFRITLTLLEFPPRENNSIWVLLANQSLTRTPTVML